MIPEKFEGMKVVQIDDWFTAQYHENPYIAPEANPVVLFGVVTGHPKKTDGKIIKTSAIVDCLGGYVKTKNTLYKLGKPKQEWLEWMRDNDHSFNPDEPVKITKADLV